MAASHGTAYQCWHCRRLECLISVRHSTLILQLAGGGILVNAYVKRQGQLLENEIEEWEVRLFGLSGHSNSNAFLGDCGKSVTARKPSGLLLLR